MVRKFLNLFYRETNSLNQAALLLGSFAFLSQVLAFLRDRLLAHIFGASAELDIYYAAFRVPDFLFVTVASIVSLSVLVPFIIEKEALGSEALREFIGSIFSFFGLLMIAVAALAYVFMPPLSEILFKEFSQSELEQTIFISRLLLLSPIILGLSNLFGSLTQAYNRFTIYASASLLYNAGIIIGIIAWGQRYGVLGVSLGVVMGAAAHLLVQVPFVIKSGLMPRISLTPNFSLIEKVVKISFPRTLTLSMSALTLIFLTAMAARMAEGSISILSFATNLQSVPLSIIGVSYSLAAFPTLTRQFQEKNLGAFIKQMETSARFIIFWLLPMTALLVVLRAQVVRVILGTGQFDWTATRLTAAALALFVLSAVFQSLTLLFMRGFYSAGNTFKPFFINLFSTTLLALSAYGLVKVFYAHENFRYFVSSLMKVEDVPGVGVLMLPLAFSFATAINGMLLWAAFEWQFRGFSKSVLRALFEGIAAAVIMGVATYAGLQIFARLFNLETLAGIFCQGLLAGILGMLAGIAVLVLLKSRELKEVWQSLHVKFWKTKVIATDPEIV